MKRILGCVAVLLLVAAVPMWAGNDRDVVNPSDPIVTNPPDPNAPAWQEPEAVLYDNGPFITHTGGGAGGADASAVCSWLSSAPPAPQPGQLTSGPLS